LAVDELLGTSIPVGLLLQPDYERRALLARVDTLFKALAFEAPRAGRVLLKPNLISAKRRDGLPCTHGQVIAAVAAWFLDHGCRVAVGDSPAFGSARGVMETLGISPALRELGVELVDFADGVERRLAGGVRVKVARQALECDLLVNLPKCKAHCQMLVSLGVKNFFGTVVGWQKPWLHAAHGNSAAQFCALIVDLLALFPTSLTVMDAIVALHETGPVQGSPCPVGLLVGSADPVAVDTALLPILGLAPSASPLWLECRRRGLAGADPARLTYPLLAPEAIGARGFVAPAVLRPVSFSPPRLVLGAVRRLKARIFSKISSSEG